MNTRKHSILTVAGACVGLSAGAAIAQTCPNAHYSLPWDNRDGQASVQYMPDPSGQASARAADDFFLPLGNGGTWSVRTITASMITNVPLEPSIFSVEIYADATDPHIGSVPGVIVLPAIDAVSIRDLGVIEADFRHVEITYHLPEGMLNLPAGAWYWVSPFATPINELQQGFFATGGNTVTFGSSGRAKFPLSTPWRMTDVCCIGSTDFSFHVTSCQNDPEDETKEQNKGGDGDDPGDKGKGDKGDKGDPGDTEPGDTDPDDPGDTGGDDEPDDSTGDEIIPVPENTLLRAIHTTIASSPTSEVPGLPGARFSAVGSGAFGHVRLSGDGTRWAMRASTDRPAAENDVILTGAAPMLTGMVVAREGTPTPWNPAINYGLFGETVSVNNSGAVAFSADTTAPTSQDAVVVTGRPGSLVVVAREGDPAPGQPAGIGFGANPNSAHVLNEGVVCHNSVALTGSPTRHVLYRGLTVVGQTDVTAPSGQLFSPPRTIDNFTPDRFFADPTGTHWIYHADLNGSAVNDEIMVVNGVVVAQEDAPLPNSAFYTGIDRFANEPGSQGIGSDGSYIFRGVNYDAVDWVYRNSAVVASTGSQITPGASERFSNASLFSTFFASTCNGVGDWVIGGATDAANPQANRVLVLNGQTVLARTGDAVDVDGNGEFDDDAFIAAFHSESVAINDARTLFFTADLRRTDGSPLGQALLVQGSVRGGGSTPCAGDFNRSGAATVQDIYDFLTDWSSQISGGPVYVGAADFNGSGTITVQDVYDFLTAWQWGCGN